MLKEGEHKPGDIPDENKEILGFIEVPVKHGNLTNALEKARVYRESREDKTKRRPVELFRSLTGNSRSIQQVRDLVEQVAESEATVLILGESGTGKEVVARNIHYYSGRRDKPFVPINCGAIPPDLLESELFGHEKGAFTGAISARQGRFEMAEGGTLFLDEIGDMPMSLQTRLLRVLAEGEYFRVGGISALKADVRIITATHQNLKELVSQGRFREDLYHRLNVIKVHLPAIRERREDIPLLLNHFMQQAAAELSETTKTLSKEVLDYLITLPWSGNVRQIENTCRWFSVMATGNTIQMNDLPDELQNNGTTPVEPTTTSDHKVKTNELDWTSHLQQWTQSQLNAGEENILSQAQPMFEKTLLECALNKTGGRKIEAARLLGWGRNTLTRKLKELYNNEKN
ncbi:MAG: sigma 54-interacting transcriptional regulator [Gammaproteobacteria bacterium]|nr:sigma 54-interacting transcriptional regulator [Gammaproteobacteria bacterium]